MELPTTTTTTTDQQQQPNTTTKPHSRKRSAEPTSAASASLEQPDSDSSDSRHKRAASEPLHHPNNKRPTPSPPLPMNSNLRIRQTQSNDLPLIGCLPLDLLLYIASFVGESELIRLSCCNKSLRRALIRTRFLWTRQLTLNVARTDLADQIRTLYLDRIQSTQPTHLTTSPPPPPTSTTAKWLSRINKNKDLILNTLRIRLHGPQVTIDTIHNKLVIIPDEPYWNTQALIFNFKLIKELMHKPLSPSSSELEPGTPQPERLQVLDIRLDGQFEQTLTAAHEAWSLAQTPWAKTIKEYRLSVGYGLARIPSFSLIALSSWMPNLKSFEVRMGTLTANEPSLRRQQQRQQRFVLGGTDFNEITPGLRSAQLIPCTIERLHLEGICFSPNLLILPQLFPNLKFIILKSLTWGRMIYELIRRSPGLEILKMIDFCFDQEMEEDLPSDWNFNCWEEDVSETGSDEGGMTLKAPPINAMNLIELHLLGEGTPHIWSVLGECIQNPIIKMPKLEKLVCESLDLEEEEQALIDLADLAPNLREISIRNCILRDEVDLYHCIRCLPDLELLDCRLTENITSNLINALALSVPNIRHLDVRGCPYVHVTSVARLAETIRDSSDSERRIEYIGVDKPLEPTFALESAQEDSVKWEIWQLWQAWNWLDFTHVLLDQEEWKARNRGRKDKMPVRPDPPVHLPVHRPQELQQTSSHGPRIRLTCRSQQEGQRPGHSQEADEEEEEEIDEEEDEEEDEEIDEEDCEEEDEQGELEEEPVDEEEEDQQQQQEEEDSPSQQARQPRPGPFQNHHPQAHNRIPYPSHHPPSQPAPTPSAPVASSNHDRPAPAPPSVAPPAASSHTRESHQTAGQTSSLDPNLKQNLVENDSNSHRPHDPTIQSAAPHPNIKQDETSNGKLLPIESTNNNHHHHQRVDSNPAVNDSKTDLNELRSDESESQINKGVDGDGEARNGISANGSDSRTAHVPPPQSEHPLPTASSSPSPAPLLPSSALPPPPPLLPRDLPQSLPPK
ncbi:hypothetical protein PGT21_003724 [Puccinia graminis f. sp. tritici]|uniref:F-box domain-containing protein n=1 Tax=Puccinia graminis f. sp. tritici TaxID=56615 RepID=A0A5B0QF09_PUCGR|nr:hypothetical protein PGT21_003724 [Puccinia graminis f. sp. tritici]